MDDVPAAWNPTDSFALFHPLSSLWFEVSESIYICRLRICSSLENILTRCSAVRADSDSEILLDRGNLEAVVHGVGSLGTEAQVKPQLVLSGSVGELIYLIQTWGSSQTESVKARRNSALLSMCACVKVRRESVLTDPELICHVAKPCYVLSPALHKVQFARMTSLEHLKPQGQHV